MKQYKTLRHLSKLYNLPLDTFVKVIQNRMESDKGIPDSVYSLKWRVEKHMAYHNPFTRLYETLERGVNGFTVSDAWDAGSYISNLVGEMLLQLKEAGSSYPPEYSFEAWQTQLEYHGRVLLQNEDDVDTLEEEMEIARAKKESMHWVANHLRTLWD